MAGNTPKGIPYPTGTDRVSDGDNAIEALARAVDAGKGAVVGQVNVNSGGTSTGTIAVTFPVGAFAAPPVVVATVNGAVSGSASAWFASATGLAPAGCNVNIIHRDGTNVAGNITVGYHAIGA